jgi:hypothetical protein
VYIVTRGPKYQFVFLSDDYGEKVVVSWHVSKIDLSQLS